MKRNMLICGATGFIGRNMAAHFAARSDIQVTCVHHQKPPFDHPCINWVKADLCNPSDVLDAMRGKDIIIQAAATTSGVKDIVSTPYIHVTDNAVMNSLLLRAAFEQHVEHFIFFSCSVMYPQMARPVRESDFTGTEIMTSNYFGAGWTKVYIEKMCEFYAGLNRTRHTVIRHSNIYGPHDKFDLEHSHVFGATVNKVMHAKDAVIVWGSGQEGRDFLYVDDLVRLVSLAIEKQRRRHELVNVGSAKVVSIKELVETMLVTSGKQLRIEFDVDNPTIKTSICLNSEYAAELYGWKPMVSLSDGIAMTLEWYRHKQLPRDLR